MRDTILLDRFLYIVMVLSIVVVVGATGISLQHAQYVYADRHCHKCTAYKSNGASTIREIVIRGYAISPAAL